VQLQDLLAAGSAKNVMSILNVQLKFLKHIAQFKVVSCTVAASCPTRLANRAPAKHSVLDMEMEIPATITTTRLAKTELVSQD